MTVLVAYATRHGSTREVAEEIAATLRALGADVELREARGAPAPGGFARGQAGSWSLVVMGAPLYSGRWHRDAHRFLRRHRQDLAGVPVAVFGLGPRSADKEAWQRSREQLGRAVAKGDVLRAGPPGPSAREGRALLPSEVPAYAQPVAVRTVLDPQEGMFPEESLESFLTASFEVTPQSNRMGYRLAGPALRHRGAADILSSGVVTGSIQVPADGQPIVLGPDRPVTGGYAKIGTVVAEDWPLVAQALPGASLRFRLA